MVEGGKQEGEGPAGVDGEHHPRRKRHERPQDQAQIVAAINALTHQLKANEEKQEGGDAKRARRETATIVLLFLTVIFTAGADWIFYRTMDDAKKAAIHAHGDNMLALDATQQALNIAHRQVADAEGNNIQTLSVAQGQLGTAQDTERRQLRAYLYVRPGPLTHLAAGESPRWSILFGAIGQTPAYKVQTHIVLVPLGYPQPFSLERVYRNRKTTSQSFKTVIYPNAPAGSAAVNMMCVIGGKPLKPCPINQVTLNTVTEAKAARLYMVGYVTYEDAFGDPHRTPFCFTADPAKTLGADYEECPVVPRPQ